MTAALDLLFSDLVIRMQSLRRRLDDANRALACGATVDLCDFPVEVGALCDTAIRLPSAQRRHAAQALITLGNDIDAYARILATRRTANDDAVEGVLHRER